MFGIFTSFSPFTAILSAFALLFALTAIARRLFTRGRRKLGDLDAYIHNHEQEARQKIENMRLETHRFSTHEALAPVEAGLRELLDLHGYPEHIILDREGDTLVLRSPELRLDVVWNFRSANRHVQPQKGKSAHIYGKGQWEIRVGDGWLEPYTQLDALMGRLSMLLRAMIRHEVTAEDFSSGARPVFSPKQDIIHPQLPGARHPS